MRFVKFVLELIRLLNDQRDQTESGIGGQTHARQKASQSSPAIIAELHIPKTAMDQYAAEQKCHNELEQRRVTYDRRRLWIEGITLGFVVLATVGAFANLWLLSESLKEARAGTNAATSAARTANDSLIIENRPWLYFDRSDFQALENAGIVETLTIRNDGRTPALNIDGCVVFEIHRLEESPVFDYVAGDGMGPPCYKTGVRVLAPNGKHPIPMRMLQRGPGAKPLIPSRRVLLDFEAGQSYLVIHARFTYKDVFDIDRWVQVCDAFMRVRPTRREQSLETCALYNDMDNNTRPKQQQSGQETPRS